MWLNSGPASPFPSRRGLRSTTRWERAPGMTLARRCCRRLWSGGGFLRRLFRARLAFLARHGLLRIVARLALADAFLVEETHDAVGRLRTLGEPRLHLLEIDFEALGVVLRQQRIEVAE